MHYIKNRHWDKYEKWIIEGASRNSYKWSWKAIYSCIVVYSTAFSPRNKLRTLALRKICTVVQEGQLDDTFICCVSSVHPFFAIKSSFIASYSQTHTCVSGKRKQHRALCNEIKALLWEVITGILRKKSFDLLNWTILSKSNKRVFVSWFCRNITIAPKYLTGLT